MKKNKESNHICTRLISFKSNLHTSYVYSLHWRISSFILQLAEQEHQEVIAFASAYKSFDFNTHTNPVRAYALSTQSPI